MNLPLEDLITISKMAYWQIFPRRIDVLHHLYCVGGNGYRWKNGRLIDVIPSRYDKLKQEALRQFKKGSRKHIFDPERKRANTWKSLYRKLDKILKKIEHVNIDISNLKPFANLETPKMGRTTCYPFSREYSKLCTIPDNVKPDYLAGAYETIKWILKLDSNLGANKQCQEIAKEVYHSLKQRFPKQTRHWRTKQLS